MDLCRVKAHCMRLVAPGRPADRSILHHSRCRPIAVWSRPQQDRDNDFIKPSYIPTPYQAPVTPSREGAPIYSPSMPEFTPAERPEQSPELPSGPKMPERRPDPIPAGNPKEKPPGGAEPERREAPPAKDSPKP